MADLLFVAVTVGFFAVTVAFTSACDRILGPDHDLDPAVTDRGGARSDRSEQPTRPASSRVEVEGASR